MHVSNSGNWSSVCGCFAVAGELWYDRPSLWPRWSTGNGDPKVKQDTFNLTPRVLRWQGLMGWMSLWLEMRKCPKAP